MKPAARKKLKNKISHKVHDVFLKERNRVMNYKQVASRLHEKDNTVKLLIVEALKELTSRGTLKEVERGRFRLADVTSTGIEGSIDISRRGQVFFCSVDLEEDVRVKSKSSIHVLKGDRVLAKIKKQGKHESAVVYELLQRDDRFFAGIIEISKAFAFLMADDPFMPVDIFIPEDKLAGAIDGQKVAVRITDWPETADSPFGEVVHVIGEAGVPDTEILSILYEFGLPTEFPQHVSDAASRIPLELSAKDLKGRKDLRPISTFTIDPEDAKDFDDAISVERLRNGSWRIGVHIADVTHYVPKGSVIEKEASLRATSIYLADRVVPMLPEILSNVLCSLRPNEDKLSFSVIFEMDKDGHVKDSWIGRTIIHSDHRFTYEDAQAIIEGGEGPFKEELMLLHSISQTLREKRFANGAFNFHSDEIRFRFDEDGRPVEVYKKTLKAANYLVEEFMLLANQTVARYVGRKSPRPPFIYRNHDSPDIERLMDLSRFVRSFGHRFDPVNRDSRDEMKQLLVDIQGSPEELIIQQMVIRSMAKADYGSKNIGHYGLAFEDYSHFTSPIRRFPDMIAHRNIWAFLNNRPGESDSDISTLARHSSLQERKAVDAERASRKFMQALFLQGSVGKSFSGRISGLTNFGIFVILDDNYCEGMVSLRSMDDDHYAFRSEDHVVAGTRHKEEYRLGDAVKVRIANVDPLSRQIDFYLL
ncbi:MAG: ribonuclease R [Flavobacteriales bacterium]|nr:ribonuclease R [Flavobacteriales bacterium]